MSRRFAELSLVAQTAYAEVLDTVRAFDLNRAVGSLRGSFSHKIVKGRRYWYFQYRDVSGDVRQIYVGPDGEKLQEMVKRAASADPPPLKPLALSALALGNQGVLPRHHRILGRLSEYGFFHAGGILVGTHAFVVLGNLLGAAWKEGARTQSVDFAHAGKNLSIALPSSIQVDKRAAIASLEMGFLPVSALEGKAVTSFLNPKEPDLRLNFLTTRGRSDRPVHLKDLNVMAQPLRFMELLLEHSVQAAILSRHGALLVNVPAPVNYGIHKLIVATERSQTCRVKANKDLLQAGALIERLLDQDADALLETWTDTLARGPTWRKAMKHGLAQLEKSQPDLAPYLGLLHGK